MGYRRKPLQLTRLDWPTVTIPAGYVQAGRYVSICPCGRAIVFRGKIGVIDCAQCHQKYAVEDVPINYTREREAR